jgi:hypothetical protein
MTPNPNKKVKYLSEIVEGSRIDTRLNQKINYDAFIFVDRLTNNKILVGDVKKNYTCKCK